MPDPKETQIVKTDAVSYGSLKLFMEQVDSAISVDRHQATLKLALALNRFKQIMVDANLSIEPFKISPNAKLIITGRNNSTTEVPVQNIQRKLQAQSKVLLPDLINLVEARIEVFEDLSIIKALNNALTLIGAQSRAVNEKRLQTIFLNGVGLSFKKAFHNLDSDKEGELIKFATEHVSHLSVFSAKLTSQKLYDSLRPLEISLGQRTNAIIIPKIRGLPSFPSTPTLDLKNLETSKKLFSILTKHGGVRPEVASEVFSTILERAAIQRANAGQFTSAEKFLEEAKSQATALNGRAAKLTVNQLEVIENKIEVMRQSRLVK
jgi:hypothetical protein